MELQERKLPCVDSALKRINNLLIGSQPGIERGRAFQTGEGASGIVSEALQSFGSFVAQVCNLDRGFNLCLSVTFLDHVVFD